MVLEIEAGLLLAVGVLALSETFGRGVFARSAPPASRVGWSVACAILALTLLIMAEPHFLTIFYHMLWTLLGSIVVHIVHARRGVPGSPTFLRANAAALLGTAPWLVASLLPTGADGLLAYGMGLAGVLIPFLPARRAWDSAGRLLARRWPVREDVVGGSLWHFVRPRTVLLAIAFALTGVALLDSGPIGQLVSKGLGVAFALAAAYAVFRLAIRAGDPLYEGRIWYRPRPNGSFILIDALAGAAIVITAITVSCEAIMLRQRLAADTALDLAARGVLLQGMETTWGMSVDELAAARGTVVTRVDPSARFLDGELERTVLEEEPGTLWRIRITVRWKAPSGADRSCMLETLRSAAGGRR
ncbi:MAG: hypothetical protein AAB434_02735 [Planctomycetota bacterium]